MHQKETYFLKIENEDNLGIGECAIFRGLSYDDTPDYEDKLKWLCKNIHLDKSHLLNELQAFPSIQFGLEQAFLSLKSKNKFELFPSKFTQSEDAIPINGLVWMGNKSYMQKQIKEKLTAGFTTIKLKIGAIDFDEELQLLRSIRKEFSEKEIALRVDANGAFTPANALQKLEQLAALNLHSIEQPIKANQHEQMALLCEKTPLPIALDEELIGVLNAENKKKLLAMIQPQFIILKPSLIGGLEGALDWIKIAENNTIGWWITSALESNIGLNAIAQFTYTLQSDLPQGLGTGGVFTNNIEAPLEVRSGSLNYNRDLKWGNTNFLFND